jgi:CHAD domain-containing protein
MALRRRYLQKFYDSEIRKFRTNTKGLPAEPSAQELHELRLWLKRLWADFCLLEWVTHGRFNAGDQFLRYQPLFKKAGRMRELQQGCKMAANAGLQRSIVHRYIEYKAAKRKKYRYGISKEIRRLGKMSMDAKRMNKTALHIKMNREEFACRLAAAIESSLRRMQKLNALRRDNSNVHKLRKALKILHRAMKLYMKLTSVQSMNENIKHLKKAEKRLGDWHDGVVLMRSLHHFLYDMNLTPDVAASVKYVIKRLEMKNTLLLKATRSEIKILFDKREGLVS